MIASLSYRAVCYLSLLLLSAPCVFSQTISPLAPPDNSLRFHRFTVNDGLSQGNVAFVQQDKLGFLWFGTAGGFDRFDGVEFAPYANFPNFPRQPVYFMSCVQNADSTFWVSTDIGIVLFNPQTGSGELFAPPAALSGKEAGYSAVGLTRISDGSLLFSIGGIGLIRFDTSSRTFSLIERYSSSLRWASPEEETAGIVPLPGGDALVVTNNRMLLYKRDRRTAEELARLMPHRYAHCVLPNSDTSAALIGTSKGLLKYENKRVTPFRLTPDQPWLDTTSIHALYTDSKGTLWIGLDDGIAAFHPKRNTFTVYRHDPANPESILPGAVTTIGEDRTENLWIGVHDQGVCRIDLKRRKFSPIVNRTGIPPQMMGSLVASVAIDRRSRVWLAGKGLTMIDRARATSTLHHYVPTNSATQYANGTKRVYALNDSLLSMIAKRVVYRYNIIREEAREVMIEGKPLTDVYRLLVRKSGSLVCVSSDSIFEVDPLRERRVRTLLAYNRQSLVPASVSVSAMVEDPAGNVWLGTTSGVLFYDQRLSSMHLMTDEPKSFVPLPRLPVLSLAWGADSILWIGTQSGLYAFRHATRQIQFYGIKDGLPNEKIWSIQLDRNAVGWVTTNRGLVRAQRRADGTMSFRTYTIGDGLTSNEFSMGANAIDSTGTIYLGGLGLVYFSPDSLQDNPHAPSIALTGMTYYGVPVPFQRELPSLRALSIPFEKKVFSLKFAALEFTDARRNHYAYKLEGYDEQWVEAGTRREAFYTNLDPGTYTLLVKASNNDNVWTEKPLAVTIEIVPPFWMTWWFRAAAGVLLLAVVAGGIRYVELRKIKQRIARLEREQALERERTRISRDMHDDLGASLTSLSMMTEIARRSLAEPADADQHLLKAAKIASETVRKLDEIVWAVSPKADNLDSLVAYISEFAQDFFSTTHIRVRFDFPPEIPDIRLASEVRHNLFLVVKELLTNIVKHSCAAEARIGIVLSEGGFTLEVRDDGKGIDRTRAPQLGNGIRNMRERVHSVGGLFSIEPGERGGTFARVQIPIRPA